MKQISTILNELEQSWQAIVRELRTKIVSAMNPGQNPGGTAGAHGRRRLAGAEPA